SSIHSPMAPWPIDEAVPMLPPECSAIWHTGEWVSKTFGGFSGPKAFFGGEGSYGFRSICSRERGSASSWQSCTHHSPNNGLWNRKAGVMKQPATFAYGHAVTELAS